MYEKDLIAALATAPGMGAIAVIRLSGEKAIEVFQKIFTNFSLVSAASHTAHYGKILDSQGQSIDHVLSLIMRAPKSYTGENTVEISCHGSPAMVQKILHRLYEIGARPAKAGEFSLRAYLNGKIDLAQAEAVQALIAAKNEEALFHAGKQLEGHLSKKIRSFQERLTHLTAILEAWVDFPEEGLEFMSQEELVRELLSVQQEMIQLKETFHEGKIIHEGLSLCLAGIPNVGKSSLLNALLKQDRAIVTDTPGTTRDLLHEEVKLGSFHFRLIDTAGIRTSEEVIEKEGIERSKRAIQEADLILCLLDAKEGLREEEKLLIASLEKKKTLLVWNKKDLNPNLPKNTLTISAKTGEGLEELKKAIEKKIHREGAPEKDQILITSHRTFLALSEAASACSTVLKSLETEVSPEFVSADLKQALYALGTILGTNVTEDILSSIFSQFCVGK